MARDATDTEPASQATTPVYRPVQRDQGPKGWVVIAEPLGVLSDEPAILAGFKTEARAQEAADTLNELEPSGQGDEVLQRMLGVSIAPKA